MKYNTTRRRIWKKIHPSLGIRNLVWLVEVAAVIRDARHAAEAEVGVEVQVEAAAGLNIFVVSD